VSRSTVLSWLRQYEGSGRRLESLYPDERADKGKARVLDDETVAALIALKKDRPGVSLPLLMKEAKQRGIVSERRRVSYATMYRLFKRHGLTDEGSPVDRRRFEAELPNDLWQSDCLHGPKALIDGKMRKTYLFAFIDDKSRLIPHAEFYGHERLDAYCDALCIEETGAAEEALRRQRAGLPLPALEPCHGIAGDRPHPCHSLSTGGQGEDRATVRMQFLPTVPEGLPLVKPNEALRQWIEVYHTTVHSSTRETPLERYLASLHLVREAPKDMDDYFRIRTLRKVDKDRTVSLGGRLYEAPVALMGKMVTLLYHEKDPARVEVLFNGASYGMLVPLDMHINARVRRSHFTILEMAPPNIPEKETVYEGGKPFGKEARDE
jgi:transposase